MIEARVRHHGDSWTEWMGEGAAFGLARGWATSHFSAFEVGHVADGLLIEFREGE